MPHVKWTRAQVRLGGALCLMLSACSRAPLAPPPVASSPPPAAEAQDAEAALAAWRRALDAVDRQLAPLEAELASATTARDAATAARAAEAWPQQLATARTLMERERFAAAALAWGEILPAAQQQGGALYTQALTGVAEALFRSGDAATAREYWLRLATQPQAPKELMARRLLEIAQRLQDWRGVEAVLNTLEKTTALPADIAYLWAKALLTQKKPREALQLASLVQESDRLYAKAAYLAAIAHVELGELDAAQTLLEKLQHVPQENSYDGAAAISHLAKLNVARLALTQGEVGKALATYEELLHSQSDASLPAALQERAWAHAHALNAPKTAPQEREEELLLAVRALETYLLYESEGAPAAKARLLMAKLLARGGYYAVAGRLYEEVIERCQPIETVMQRSAADPGAAFDALAELIDTSPVAGRVLPADVLAWSSPTALAEQALRLLHDLDRQENTQRTLALKLGAVRDALAGRGAVAPEHSRAYWSLLAAEHQLVDLLRQSAPQAELLARASLTPPQATTLERLNRERDLLEAAYADLPRSVADYEERQSLMQGWLGDLTQRAFAIQGSLEEMRRQSDGLRSWLASHAAALTPLAEADYRRNLRTLTASLVNALQEWRRLQQSLRQARARCCVADLETEPEQALRRRYTNHLEQRWALWQEVAPSVTALTPLLALHRDVNQTRTRVARLTTPWREVSAPIKRAAQERAAQLEADLKRLTETVAALHSDGQQVGLQVALQQVRRRAADVHGLIMQGHFGISGLAWQRHEAARDQLNRRASKHRAQLQALEQTVKDAVWLLP